MSEMNVVIDNGNIVGDESHLFFSDEPIVVQPASSSMYDLLVLLGAFTSKGQARKNWSRSGRDVPPGFSDFDGIGKMRHRLTVLNPTPDNLA